MEKFQYFMDCYLHMGEDLENLDIIINEFKQIEREETKRKLILNLSDIIHFHNYEKASQIIKKHGNRTFSTQMTKVFIKYLYDRLNDIPTYLTPLDFYKMK